MPADRVRLIWNGAPLDEFAPVPRERALRVRRELGLPDDALVVGHDRPPQRPEGPPLPPRGRGTRCCRAGPQARVLDRGRRRPDGRAARSRPRRSGIADRVVFAGHRTDVPDLLGALDVFCISSLYEGTPLALFEAMAAGKAIVSTSVDGCREVLEDGVTGVLVPPGRRGGARRRPRPRPRRRRAARGARPAGARRLAPLRRARVRRPDAGLLRRAARRREGAERAPAPARPQRARGVGGAPRPAAAAATPRSSPAASCPAGDVPVFVFHGAEPESFSRKLAHLADNGYVTLSADEYVAVLRGRARAAGARRRAHLRRRARLGVERGRAPAAPARHEGRGVPRPRAHRRRARARRRRPGTTSRRAARTRRPSCGARRARARSCRWEEIEALARDGPLRLPEPHPPPRPRPHRPAARRLRDAPLAARLRRVRPAARRGTASATSWARRSRSARRSSAPPRAPRRRCASSRTRACGPPASPRSPRRAARASSCAPTGRRACARVFGRTRVTGRVETRRREGARPSGASSPSPAGSSRSAPAGPSCTSATRGTRPAPRRDASPPRPATRRRSAARWPASRSRAPAATRARSPGSARTTSSCCPGRGRATLAEVLRRKWARRFGGALR